MAAGRQESTTHACTAFSDLGLPPMKRMLSCAVASLILMTNGAAADGPAVSRPWTGFYIGAGAGAGSITQDQSLIDPGFGTLFSQSAGAEGLFGTVTAGYDYRVMQRVVVGGFFDYDFSRISNDNPAFFPVSIPFQHNHTWSIGGRVGYLANPTTLWYVVGGYSQASFDFDFDFGTTGSANLSGYFVGGGVETQLVGNWSLRGEYRFTQFRSETLLEGGCICAERLDAETSMHSGRVLLIYKFGTADASAP